MATLTNTNFWIYFIKTDDADRVTCKICRRSLKSKRSFNLRQHLKQSHKIEVRADKKYSNIKSQQLLTCSNEAAISSKGVNYWTYFTNNDKDDKVTCKICFKILKSNHGFNLRQHLKHSHKVEFRLQKRTSNKNKHQISPNDAPSLTSELKEDLLLKIKNTKRKNDSLRRMSACSTILDIKEETIQRLNTKSYVDTVELAEPFEASSSESDDNEEISRQNPLVSPQNIINNRKHNVETSTQNSLIKPLFLDKSDAVVEPPAISRENTRDPLSSFNVLTNGEERSSHSNKKNARFADDEVAASNRNDSFEIWAKKKKLLLEIEELEMRNYKIKLELWEKEQNLRLMCSKFTKDIRSNK